MSDQIHIHDLALRTIVGVYDFERRERQDVVVSLTLHVDLRAAGKSDRLKDTLDYDTLHQKVALVVENSSFQLVEALAEAVAVCCLADPRVEQVDVVVEKPGALPRARTIAIHISRTRESS